MGVSKKYIRSEDRCMGKVKVYSHVQGWWVGKGQGVLSRTGLVGWERYRCDPADRVGGV